MSRGGFPSRMSSPRSWYQLGSVSAGSWIFIVNRTRLGQNVKIGQNSWKPGSIDPYSPTWQVYFLDYVLNFPPFAECGHLTRSPPSVVPLCQRDAWSGVGSAFRLFLGGPSAGLVVVVSGCLSGGSLCRPYPPEPFIFLAATFCSAGFLVIFEI